MRVLALLLLSLLAVAHADVLIRSEEPDKVPGLHHETLYVVDDSPEARNAGGASPVREVMTHTSASGPRAVAALFGSRSDLGHLSAWMDQQMGALRSVHQALLPAIVEAPPRRRGCSRHKKAMAAAAAAGEGDAVPASYSSLDEALLQRMAAARLSPQLLSALVRDVQRDEPAIIAVMGPQEHPRPQIAMTESSFEAGSRGNPQVFGNGESTKPAAQEQAMAVRIVCDGPECTVHYEPAVLKPDFETLPSSRIFDARFAAGWNPESRDSFGELSPVLGPALEEGFGGGWQADDRDMLSPLNPGLVLFVLLSAACVAVWARLAILCCTLRQCVGHRRRRCRKGAVEAPLLEPLEPESAAADSLAIYTDTIYAAPKGRRPPLQPARPYSVQVASEHTTAPPGGNAYVTIQYVPLQSEGATTA